ncbi:MAG: sialidase family protein [Pseudonocardiales bacterium]
MSRSRMLLGAGALGVFALVAAAQPALATHGGDTLVSVGSPVGPFSANKQNEPALAVDQHAPNVLAAGSNDEIDIEKCAVGDPTMCPFTQGVGVSGIYFSFNSGDSWIQPTYQGWTARATKVENQGYVGPIGTLPKYYENGLVSDGDPALAFGPRRGTDGQFSWANGSRLYYANLTSNFSGSRTEGRIKGYEAIAVSRTDDVHAAAAGDASAWKDPVIAAKNSATTFADKEQIWADNAALSPNFGNVYVCYAEFRSNSLGYALPTPLVVATSTDGGDTWTKKQVGPAVDNGRMGLPDGCTVRTDSLGNVYVFGVGKPTNNGPSGEVMYRSTDGGKHWSRPVLIAPAVEPGVIDPVLGRPVMDGVAGARVDLAAAPSVDIANGASTGSDATNEIVMTWADGRDGLNHEKLLLMYSNTLGRTWSGPITVPTAAGDRPVYTAPAISPNGTDLYVVYNAFTNPYRDNTTDPRGLVGVVLHADVSRSGAPAGWTALHRGAVGDPRGTSQNGLTAEFLGDYVYAVATRTYGAAVWNDARNAADCPAIDAWRMSLRTGTTVTRPSPGSDCDIAFGNSDIYGGSYADPTP